MNNPFVLPNNKAFWGTCQDRLPESHSHGSSIGPCESTRPRNSFQQVKTGKVKTGKCEVKWPSLLTVFTLGFVRASKDGWVKTGKRLGVLRIFKFDRPSLPRPSLLFGCWQVDPWFFTRVKTVSTSEKFIMGSPGVSCRKGHGKYRGVNTNMKVLHYVTCEDYIVKLAFWESVLWKILRWRGANFGELIGGLVIWMVCCCRGGYMSCLCIGSMCVLFICHSRCKRNWMLFSPYRTLVAQVPHISWGRKGFIIVPGHISIYTKEIWIVSPGDRTVSPPDKLVVFP